MASISVFGLGYVGCVGIACLAKLGHKVVGCDVDESKVRRIAKGLPTIVERDVDEVMQEGFKAGLISATMSPMEASLVCLAMTMSPRPISRFCVWERRMLRMDVWIQHI